MRILVLGKNYTSRNFCNFFRKNKENIVFSLDDEITNLVDLNNYQDIAEFCEANEINLVLICDEQFIIQELTEKLNEKEIFVFSPSYEAAEITLSKASAKRFAHKNKIPTAKFQIVEKPQAALDYIKTRNILQVIKPDTNSYQECAQFSETIAQAQKIVYDFFSKGNKRLVIEDYIEGKNITFWTLCDGYDAEIIGTCAKYQNELALFEPNFINNQIKQKIYDTIITPTIQALEESQNEYIGVLGFNIMLDFNENPYLINYYNFFDDLSVNFFTQGLDIPWQDIFVSTIEGDVFQRFEFIPDSKSMLTIIQNDEINFIQANTKTNLRRYLKEMNFDLTLLNEAQKLWKF